jgi:potassium-dependent mechanosensitive channel
VSVRVSRGAAAVIVAILLSALGAATAAPTAAVANRKAPAPGAPPGQGGPTGEAATPSGAAPAGGAAPSAGSPTTTAESAPEPLPPHAIPGEAEAVETRVARIPDPTAPDPILDDARRSIAEVESALAALERDRQRTADSTVGTVDLEDWRQQYLRLDRALTDQEAAVGKVAESADTEIGALGRLARQWERTSLSIVSEGVPAVIGQRVTAVRDQISVAIERLQVRRMTFLETLVRIADLRRAIDESVLGLEEALKARQKDLFVIESAPLWSVLRHPPQRLGPGQQLLETWRDVSRTVARFLRESRGTIVLHLVLFAAILGATLALRARESRREGGAAVLALSARILARPVQASLLVALLVTPWIYRQVPLTILRLTFMALVVPLLAILPAVIEPRWLPRVRAAAVLFVLDRLVALAAPHSLLLRVMLLGVTVVAIVLIAWSLQKVAGEVGRALAARRAVSVLALALLTMALIGNLVGNSSLAEFLVRGTLGSVYAAIVMYVAARVLESLWAAAWLTGPFRRLDDMVPRAAQFLAHGQKVIRAAAVTFWALATLHLFSLAVPVLETVGAALRTPLVLGNVTLTSGDIATFLVTIAAAVILARALRFTLEQAVLPRLSLPRGIPTAVSATVQYVVLAAGLLLATFASGVDMSKFAFLAGALGVGIGFGLQNVVNNFVSGLILLYERPIQEGDTIEIGAVLGVVRRIGVRSSTLRTFDGAEVIVPNATLIAQEVVNWTLSDRMRRVEIKVGVAYGTDPARVLDLLLRAARGRPGVLEAPPAVALFTGFGDSALEFLLRFWTADFDNWTAVQSDLRAAVYAALTSAEIEIPFPQHDVHVTGPEPVPAQQRPGIEIGKPGEPDPRPVRRPPAT